MRFKYGIHNKYFNFHLNTLGIIITVIQCYDSHGHYPSELLQSTIVSIPKDKTASLSNSDNYRGISVFNSIHKLFDCY